jgi:hypothetical protein
MDWVLRTQQLRIRAEYSIHVESNHLTTMNTEFKSSCLVSEQPTTPASINRVALLGCIHEGASVTLPAATASPRVLRSTPYLR